MRNVSNITHEIKYHFVFCSRYRRRVLVGEIEERFTSLVHDVCNEYGWDLLKIDVYPDYCHLYLECLPTDRPTDIMARIKNYTSRALRNDFEELNHLESLWTRAFLVTTSDYLSSFEVELFLGNQKTRN